MTATSTLMPVCAGVLRRVGQRFGDHVVGGELDRFGQAASIRMSSSTGTAERRASDRSAETSRPW